MKESAPWLAVASAVAECARWVLLFLETTGIVLITYGAIAAVTRLWRRMARRETSSFVEDRLVLARYLAWALEFQLAADIVDTAIAPDWQKIGQVAAIATIRTALNYALGREMRDERERLDGQPRSNGGSSARA